MFAWFYARGAGGAFIESTLVQNVGWVTETTARTTLSWLATRDPMLAALGIFGAVRAATVVVRTEGRRAASVVTVCAGSSLAIGLFVIPTPYPQYLLPVLPMLSVFAADLLVSAATRAEWAWTGLAVVAAFAFCLLWARPVFMAPWVYPAVFAALLLLAWTFVKQRPAVAVAIVVVAASVYQTQQLRWMRGLTNDRQLMAMALVQRLTAGTRPTVLDGFTGYGWFRPHAWRYHFLHAGVRARLSEADRQELAAGLRSGRVAPGAVLFDAHLRAVSSDVSAAIEGAFEPTDTMPVWAPRRRRE
jgi:hypothetical protein